MTGLVFVDTNVLLYAVDTSEVGRHERAREWLQRLWRDRIGRTGVQVLSEFYVNATGRLSPGLPRERAWEFVAALAEWCPQPVDFQVLEIGTQVQARYQLSWWDSLVIAAAQLQGCGTLLTEDLQHEAVYAGVTAINPFLPGVQEDAAVYAPQVAAPQPRGRGRPRKSLLPART